MNISLFLKIAAFTFVMVLTRCGLKEEFQVEEETTVTETKARIPVLFDTDANNELDDQHAMIYLLFSDDVFDLKGMTTNATRNGGRIAGHMEEAERILQLADRQSTILLPGADSTFEAIAPQLSDSNYDGHEAVEFIIEESRKATPEEPLVLLPVGKLTNIALAMEKAPDIKDRIHIVWLGSNYPRTGEYNLVNDTSSLTYVLEQDVPFEMVLVRYQDKTAAQRVEVTQEEVRKRMPGLGPKVETPIVGRHGGEFNNFGDYSVDLFEHIDYHTPEMSRALYDAVAVAILKNPEWGKKKEIPAPRYVDGEWVEQPTNERMIAIWEDFDKEAIVEDFFAVLDKNTETK